MVESLEMVRSAIEPENYPPKPFSAEFTRQFGLRTASNAQRAAESLESHDLIEREESSFVIIDRFLRLWIRQLFSR